MRRNFTTFIPVFIMLVMAVICVFVYMFFTNKLPKYQRNQLTANTQSENNIILSKDELPRLDAAVNLQPLMTAVVKDFTQDGSVSDGIFNYSDTDSAYKKLINGEVDIIFATYPSSDVLAMAKARGIEFDIVSIVKEGLVFLVNRDNQINSLSVTDIQQIYTGQVSNWSQLDGENIDIKAFQKNYNSTTQAAMMSLVMGNSQMLEPQKKVFYDRTFGEITDVIANYDNSKNAIGYSFYYDAQNIYDIDEKVDNGTKLLEIDGIAPSYDTIHDGSYPLQMNYYLIKNKENNYENVQIFVNGITSDRGKKAIKEAGYIDN